MPNIQLPRFTFNCLYMRSYLSLSIFYTYPYTSRIPEKMRKNEENGRRISKEAKQKIQSICKRLGQRLYKQVISGKVNMASTLYMNTVFVKETNTPLLLFLLRLSLAPLF